jgi:hypothetical protein
MYELIFIYFGLGLFIYFVVEEEDYRLNNFFAVVTFWPVVLVILLYKYYRKNYILRWMDSCEIVKHHLIRMSLKYTADERFPDTLDYYGITSRYVVENCLEPAMRIFNLEDTPEGWKRAFQYCIRTKRRSE